MGCKKTSLLACAMVLCASVYGQGMFGFMAGAGYTIGYKSYVTPTAESYYLGKLSHHFYAGGSISVQRYSLQKDLYADGAAAPWMQPLSIRHKTSYFFLCGKADMGIGYRNLYHVHVAAGPGFAVGGEQWATERFPFAASNTSISTLQDVSTSYDIRNVIVRVTAGISERIPTYGYWNIMLSQEFTMVPTNLSKGGQALNVNYVSFTVGIMHKYPQVLVEY